MHGLVQEFVEQQDGPFSTTMNIGKHKGDTYDHLGLILKKAIRPDQVQAALNRAMECIVSR